MKDGYLKEDRQERFNTKRGWFVKAYRIVSPSGEDMIQPWMNTKREARECAKAMQINLIEQ
jgi:hypothetical protein